MATDKLGIKDLYLFLFNSASCLAWFTVLVLALGSLLSNIPSMGLLDALANAYFFDNLAKILLYAQSAALLEILHAALGLVRSPLLVTTMQVGSRVVALVAIALSPQAQGRMNSWILSLLLLESTKWLVVCVG
jgi:very-long-chain (3R)-3-hydroxyacyl-CoA dehydratase